MAAPEGSAALLLAFPEDKELAPAQIAACAPFAREHVVYLCIADPLPIQVRLRGKQVLVRQKDLGDFFDQDIAEVRLNQAETSAVILAVPRSPNLSRREVIEYLFRAELRFALFSAESMQAFAKLVDSIGSTNPAEESASPVDERCRELFQMEQLVLRAQASSMHVGLRGLILDTAAVPEVTVSLRNHRSE